MAGIRAGSAFNVDLKQLMCLRTIALTRSINASEPLNVIKAKISSTDAGSFFIAE
jgi:hypothetical protein